MNTVRPFLVIALMLAGCASSGTTQEADNGAIWWNPLTYSWSSLTPWHWFSSAAQVSEQGVGKLNGSTAMNEQAISDGLNGNYKLRKGMRVENGTVITFFQAVDEGKVKMEVTGDATVSRIEVMDSAIATDSGVKIGTPFSDLYSKAFGACQKATGSHREGVECKVDQHISYVFTGEWHGPESLLPSDDTLKKWTVSKIIWRR